MNTLDNDFDYIDPSTVSPWQTALRYGGIGGVILMLVGLIMYLTGMTDYEAAGRGESGGAASWIANILNWVVWIGGTVMAIKFHKEKELGGYITFGRAFFTGFLTALVMGVIGAIWTYVFFAFIAPETLEMMTEGAMANIPEDQLEATEGMMGAILSPGFFAASMIGMALIGGSIVSLIASAVLKREHPAA